MLTIQYVLDKIYDFTWVIQNVIRFLYNLVFFCVKNANEQESLGVNITFDKVRIVRV